MAEKQDKEKQMQQKYMEFQMLERQLKQVQAQIEQIEAQIGELVFLQQSLTDIKQVTPGKELFVPVGAGIFVNAELKNNKDVLVNVGSGVVVKKTIDEAHAIIERQAREMRALEEERAQKLAELSMAAGSVEQELAKFVEEENNV